MIFLVCMEDRMEKKTKFDSEWKNLSVKALDNLEKGKHTSSSGRKWKRGMKTKYTLSWAGRGHGQEELRQFSP